VTKLNLTDVYFISQTTGWAVGEDGIMIQTSDGGTTWTDVDTRVTHRLEKIVFAGGRGWAVGYGGTVIMYDPFATNGDPGYKPSLDQRN
jgi:photosystem II stability/assembly factor-like uncharacterized protein